METTEIIKSKIKILSLFEDNGISVKIVNSGSKGLCLCPFHNERTPSCWLDFDKNVFHCFGCKKGGDIFEFVKYKHNINEFPKLIDYFIEKYNLENIKDEVIRNESYILSEIDSALKHKNSSSKEFNLYLYKLYSLTRNINKYCEKRLYSEECMLKVFNIYKTIDKINEIINDNPNLIKDYIHKLNLIEMFFNKKIKTN